MALFHINYYSEPLQKQTGMIVIASGCGAPCPVVYLLHGLSDDYTIWQRRTSIERYVERCDFIVVMLDGARSFYTDMPGGLGNYEQHILYSVRFIDATFRTIDSPAARGIEGLSMGGYGAIKLGLKYPEIFGSAVSHSGALDITALLQAHDMPDMHAIYGEQVKPDEDCLALAARPGPKPALRIDCGVDDFLIEQNRRFHAHLASLNIPHEYAEFPGEHTWDYWDVHVQEGLRFHRNIMRHTECI